MALGFSQHFNLFHLVHSGDLSFKQKVTYRVWLLLMQIIRSEFEVKIANR